MKTKEGASFFDVVVIGGGPSGATAARLLSGDILVEMKWARFWRGLVHTLGKTLDYRVLGAASRFLKKEMEETLHGQRTFRLLRRTSRRSLPLSGVSSDFT